MDKTKRNIAILLFEGANCLDIAGAAQTFSSSNDVAGPYYDLRYLSIDGAPVTASCALRLHADAVAEPTDQAEDLLVPGGLGVNAALDDPRYSDLIARWSAIADDRRIISVCSGALLLAAAGVLDGKTATTHWGRERQARELFPDVLWDTKRLYSGDERIMTSAGVTAGIDLALSIVQRDRGSAIALRTAREMVVYLQRSGGQHQFSDLLEAQFARDGEVGKLIDALISEPGRNWTLETMADAAGLTPRTLSRRFTSALDQSPTKVLERIRVKRAADALSSGAQPLEAALAAGFMDLQQMQRAFKRQMGSTVGAYRRRFASAPVS